MCILLIPGVVDARGYKVTPRVIDKEVKQRDIFTETITITNNNNYTLNIYATVNAVSVDEGGDIVDFTAPSVSDGTVTPTSWIELKRSRISIPAGGTREVPLGIKIHPKAEAGVYHVLLGFGSGINRPEAERQVKQGTAPTIMLTLSVEQNKTEFLKLSRFLIDRFVTKPENSAITYTLSNPGTADVVPTGEIIFSNSRGEEVATIAVNPNKELLTPGQETTFSTAAPTDDMLGKYKAFLTVDYGTEQLASVYDTAFFYVVPWQKLLIIFLILLIVTTVATVLLHRRMNAGYEEVDHEEVPLFLSDTQSEEHEHDINLRK